jgi:hypothetical protein
VTWRVVVFIASLLAIAAAPIPDWTRLPIGCTVYLVVVLPALARHERR